MALNINVLRNLALVLISVMLMISLTEVSLRFFDLPPYPDHLPVGIYESDDQTGFRFKADTKDNQSAYEYKVELEINSIGLRDRKDVTEKTVPYAFAIGDSFTEGGHGLILEKTIPKVLESRAGKYVANLGIGGVGTREEVYLYERYLTRFLSKPKLAILFFYVGNDLYDNGQSEHGAVGAVIDGYRVPRSFGAEQVSVNGNIVSLKNKKGGLIKSERDREFHPRITIGLPLIEQTKIYNMLVNALPMSGKRPCAIPVAIPGLFDKHFDWDKSVEWRETKKWISKFDRLSKESGVVPMVVIIPAKYQVIPELLRQLPECGAPESIDTDTSINMLRGFLEKEGIKYLDVTDEIRKSVPETDRRKLYFVSDSHLTPSGADFVAGKVFNVINGKDFPQ